MSSKRLCTSASTSTPSPPRKKKAATATNRAAPPPTGLQLPNELIIDILSRVPIKSLFKFRCVCKSWDALFFNIHFLESYKHVNPPNPKILMIHRNKMLLRSIQVSTLCRDKSGVNAQHLYFPVPTNRVRNHVRNHRDGIIGSCNGLLCLRVVENEETIYFWNPLTNQSLKLPYTFSDSHHLNVFGFGFDDSINEFKLVRLFTDLSKKTPFKGEVYGMWEGSRRPISDFPFGHPFSPGFSGRSFSSGIYLNGALHWVASVASNSWIIAALDLAKETYQTVFLPKQEDEWEDVSLYCVGKLLCIMVNYHLSHDDVWVMKEYGVKESWVKMVTIPFSEHPMPSRGRDLMSFHSFSPEHPRSLPLYFSERNGEFLMIYNGKLVLYKTREELIENLKLNRLFEKSTCHIYVDSLFTPSVMMGLRGESYQQNTTFKVKSIDGECGVRAWCKLEL